MRVKTLDNNSFKPECMRLARKVHDSGFSPDLIIGIRTGGEYVAREIHFAFPDANLSFVELHRPSTEHKHRIKKFLPLLPTPLLNLLRILEARIFSMRKPDANNLPPIELPDDPEKIRRERILLVDDAIDSGKTLLTIKKSLSEKYSDTDIRTAVITVTTKNPLILPDYKLYHNETLIRFPWSFDNKI